LNRDYIERKAGKAVEFPRKVFSEYRKPVGKAIKEFGPPARDHRWCWAMVMWILRRGWLGSSWVSRSLSCEAA